MENNPEKAGIMLYYKQASSGQPRMVFSFGFVADKDIESNDEGYVIHVVLHMICFLVATLQSNLAN